MTNAQIIFNNRVFLMEQGVIKGTDQRMMFTDENGQREIAIPEEIHTFDEWKRMGFMVQKGQHSVAKFQIWMPKKNKKVKAEEEEPEQDQEETEKIKGFYKKVAAFFTADQVKKIAG